MKRFVPFLLLSWSCSGTDNADDTFVRPETCDDGVDNNDNGLVDCEDTQFCGGHQCQTQGDDDDSYVPPPVAEVVYDAASCCNFEFASGDCPKSIGTVGVVNRSEELDGEVDASCDLVGPDSEATITFQVQGGAAPPTPFIVNEEIFANSSLTLEAFFNCAITSEFTTHCRVKIEVGQESDEVEFDITGTPAM